MELSSEAIKLVINYLPFQILSLVDRLEIWSWTEMHSYKKTLDMHNLSNVLY